ncbi:MAG: phosphatidylglycerophosphatase A [Candidatus Competibacterales bacterium]|nr:phosphatidylglycerophosphatase A [Candidatus Competibacterales bacterium]
MSRRRPAFRLSDPRQLIALGFGAGLAPRAPGTAGTLVAVPPAWLLSDLAWPAFLALIAAAFLLGVAVCGFTARVAGVHDHPAIVWDEVVGYLVTVSAVPGTPLNLLLGFLLFRVFDILKPWPVGALDRRVTGGLGIMADDLVAGLMAGGVLALLQHAPAGPW